MHIGEVFTREPTVFAIGHFGLGYLEGKGTSKMLHTKLNLPLLLAVSVIPDMDLILQYLYPGLFMHRGPTHSIVVFTVLMIPFFIMYRKQAAPYYAALLSHSLIGDYFTGGIELFWPVSQQWFGFGNLGVDSLLSVTAEIALFAVALAIMFKTNDVRSLLEPNRNNLWLLIAFGAVLGPMLSFSEGTGGTLPLLLVIPSLFCLALFGYSLLISLRSFREKPSMPARPNKQEAGAGKT